jgi:site-specific recombinase XerD
MSAQIAPWIRRFLVEHIIIERNLSQNTQKSYRDTLTLLLPFVAKRAGVSPDQLVIEHLSPDAIREFFQDLQNRRGCTTRTCNQRLAAIHALAQFIAWRSPEHILWAGQIKAVPFKKTAKAALPYLDKPEMDAIIAAPDQSTHQGRRDHALLLFMYNTGARASEVAGVTVADLDLKHSKSVKITGKGNKIRYCPLWKQTIVELEGLSENKSPTARLFINRRGQALTRFGIHTLVEKNSNMAEPGCPSLKRKKISPHTIRHTTAVHLLRSGVDINTIRAWLGHVSIDTTNIYAEVDLSMKSKALALCEIGDESQQHASNRPSWKENSGLMDFLKAL